MGYHKTAMLACLGLAVAVAAMIWLSRGQQQKALQRAQVANFTQCAAAGYPIAESFPRQCRTPDGRTFIEEQSVQIECGGNQNCPTGQTCVNHVCQ